MHCYICIMYLASDIGICVKLFCRNVRYSCTACKSDTWARQHLCGIFAFPLGSGRTISSHIDIDLSNLFDFRIHSIVFSIYHIRLAHGCTLCTRYVRKKNYNRPEVHPNRNMRFLPLGKNRQLIYWIVGVYTVQCNDIVRLFSRRRWSIWITNCMRFLFVFNCKLVCSILY